MSRLSESRRELLNLRFQLATGQLDNPSRMGQVRRDVARILTILREREIAEAEGTPVPTAALRRRRAGSAEEEGTPSPPGPVDGSRGRRFAGPRGGRRGPGRRRVARPRGG